MSKKILWIATLLISFRAFAQNCQSFLFLQKNKTIEMTIYNKKGEPNGRQIYLVSDVVNAGNTTTASLASEMLDQKGRSMSKANSSVQCTGGMIQIDMKLLLPQQQSEKYGGMDAKAQSFYLDYPAVIHVGDALKDGNLTMDIGSHASGGPPGPPGPPGFGQTLTMVISDRKVEGQENVTTAAGTWSCYKIGYKCKIKVKTGPIGIPVNFEGTEWYAPGFGVVKTESKYGSTAITSIK